MGKRLRSEEQRDLRYRRVFFPNCDDVVFKPESGGTAQLPILLRKVMRRLSAAEFRVLVYLHLCAERSGMCGISLDEMVYDLGVSGSKHVKPHLRSLEEKGFISLQTAPVIGKTFALILDVRVALAAMIEKGELPDADVLAIRDLCDTLKLPFTKVPRKPGAAPGVKVQGAR